MTTSAPIKILAISGQAEKELLSALALKEPTYAEIDALLAKYRTACEAVLLKDFAAAVANNTELRLWNAHGKINSKYRSRLAKFRDEEGQKRPVERRKLEKHYLDFIKSSMRFYRGYIQRLASHFRGPREILEVVHKLHLDTLSVDPAIEPSQQEKQLVLESCHATLVRLGDLSRYRETELQTKVRDWAPAVGYYNLATAIKPSSGFSHNQLAVIALADGDHMRALYHLYRASCVQVPYPRARENLETEYKKILDRKNKNKLLPPPVEQQPGVVLQAWFVYLHARLHEGVNFPEHEELENEVLTNLSVELKERPLDGLLNKFALSNIAAQHLASVQAAELNGNASKTQAFVFFLRFNINTFFTLLQILLQELEQIIADDDELGKYPSTKNTSEKISATARRILPCLRQYSSWLISSASHLVTLEDHEIVGVQVTEFWRVYADALTLLAATFRNLDLQDVDYLLDEDEDTVAFTPFTNPHTLRRYFRPDGQTLKPRSRDHGVERHHPSVEMLFRVKDLLEDGIALVARQDDDSQGSVPLTVVDNSRFEYKEKGLPPEPSYNKSHHHSHSSVTINRDDIERAKHNRKPVRGSIDIPDDTSESVAPSGSVGTSMHRMVDGLVASEISDNQDPPTPHFPQISHGDSPPTPTADTFDDDAGAHQTSQQSTTTAGPPTTHHEPLHATLPSIWNSPFAPRPGEAPSSPHTRPGTAHKYSVPPAVHPPVAQSSHSRFQEALLRQQQELQMQQSSASLLSDSLPTPSLSQAPSTTARNQTRFLGAGAGGDLSPIITPSPFASSPSIPSTTFPSYDVPRLVPRLARFGAVGEVLPPSGQGG